MKIVFLSALFASILLSSCSSDDDPKTEVENQEEVITNFNVTLEGGGDTIILSAIDSDGDEEIDQISDGTLKANTVYIGSITLSNEIEDENITEEIEEEDDEHQFFFDLDVDLDISMEYTDEDDNGNPVGLSFLLETGDILDSGIFTVTLIHQPNKSAEGVAGGDITNAGGETDFEVNFEITVVPVALATN